MMLWIFVIPALLASVGIGLTRESDTKVCFCGILTFMITGLAIAHHHGWL